MQLKLDRLTKQYGSKIAVDRVSATLTRGVYGLVFPDKHDPASLHFFLPT